MKTLSNQTLPHTLGRYETGSPMLEHTGQHEYFIIDNTTVYWMHLLHRQRFCSFWRIDQDHKLKAWIEQTLKRQSEDVKGRKRERGEQQTDWEDYYSVIRALWSRTDMDRSRFPASHTSICHFTMQRIRTHTLPLTHTGGEKCTLKTR